MHDTAFQIGTLAMNIYADLKTAAILEVGSQAVNGSLRDNALPTTTYVGVDIEEGDGVDIVVEPGKPFPVNDDAFDLVMASSAFEHDPCFWMTFLEMCRAAKEGAYIYVNAPSNGYVHRFPQDNWRFYPDSGKALASWAVSQGQPVTLVESFIAERDKDVWNDFVAVFRKGRITQALPKVFVHEQVACSNVITWKSNEFIRPSDVPQDMVLLAESEKLCAQFAEQTAQLAARLAEAEEQGRQQIAEYNSLREQLVEADKVRGDLAMRESELRQRQEEIEQTRCELDQLRQDREEIGARLSETGQRLELEEALRGKAETALLQWKALYEDGQVRIAELTAAESRFLAEHSRDLRKAEADLQDARAAISANETKLSERYQELATLANLLRQQERRTEDAMGHLQWLVALNERLRTQPRWWTLMPRLWRRKREQQRLQRAGLFHGSAYLKRYPDVAEAGIDALDHYLRHGIHEGRSRAL